MKRIRYVFPKTINFREVRPVICWEHMYGWMEGYSVLFDPVVASLTQVIPEWENGWAGEAQAGDFVVTSCAQASDEVKGRACPGLYVRPSSEVKTLDCVRLSEKERLSTPIGEFFYPFRLHYDRYAKGDGSWRLGGRPAVIRNGDSASLCFELFAMFGWFRSEMPEQCFTACADVVAVLLKELGLPGGRKEPSGWQSDLRIDFHAYGLNRLLIQWLLDMEGVPRTRVIEADTCYSEALAAWRGGERHKVANLLQKAFEKLAEIRVSISPTDFLFLEYPHLGILFEDKGFFELEWPEESKNMFLSYFDQIERHAYKISLEAGASCWRNLADRYPNLGAKLKTLWETGAVELTNGTFSLPYALMSPLSLQYWQFRKGRETFEKTFGRVPRTYQCQENSLTPQMPELLRHFGYDKAFHVTQNHGEAPAEKADFIKWTSPSGHSLPALTVQNPILARKGANYYLDLPLVRCEYGRRPGTLNYINLQDLGYVPFRCQMIRAHKYAPVWGRYALADEAFQNIPAENVERKSYTADAYRFSEKFFYPNETNVNSLSHYERIYELVGLRRQILLASLSAGRLSELRPPLDEVIEELCLLEAHDCCYVQGQRRGEFHSGNTFDTPPYSRETLTQKLAEIIVDVSARLAESAAAAAPGGASKLYNAAEAPLHFARVRFPKLFTGGGIVQHRNFSYAAGSFDAFTAADPTAVGMLSNCAADECGDWKVCSKASGVEIIHGGRRISFRPVDRKQGYFMPLKSECRKAGPLRFATFTWSLDSSSIQLLETTLVFTDYSGHAEILVRYTPRADFAAASKWDDYLALEFDVGEPLKKVFRFNPNFRSPTAEDRVASPCYLAVEGGDGKTLSLLNEGTPLYELDRGGGKVKWVFHVACETVHERRMALAFGGGDSFHLSRAWAQGVLPLKKVENEFLGEHAWDGISVEDVVGPNTLLVSNLRDSVNESELGQGASFRPLVYGKPEDSSTLSLKPFELGLITIA